MKQSLLSIVTVLFLVILSVISISVNSQVVDPNRDYPVYIRPELHRVYSLRMLLSLSVIMTTGISELTLLRSVWLEIH